MQQIPRCPLTALQTVRTSTISRSPWLGSQKHKLKKVGVVGSCGFMIGLFKVYGAQGCLEWVFTVETPTLAGLQNRSFFKLVEKAWPRGFGLRAWEQPLGEWVVLLRNEFSLFCFTALILHPSLKPACMTEEDC